MLDKTVFEPSYETFDGKIFDDKNKATVHEKEKLKLALMKSVHEVVCEFSNAEKCLRSLHVRIYDELIELVYNELFQTSLVSVI